MARDGYGGYGGGDIIHPPKKSSCNTMRQESSAISATYGCNTDRDATAKQAYNPGFRDTKWYKMQQKEAGKKWADYIRLWEGDFQAANTLTERP